MTQNKNNPSTKRREWIRPELVRLGTIRDIAGPKGVGLQSGPNSRS